MQSLTWYFNREGYETAASATAKTGQSRQTLLPDRFSSTSCCREWAASKSAGSVRSTKTRQIPIIMITARAEETDQIEGFAGCAMITSPSRSATRCCNA